MTQERAGLGLDDDQIDLEELAGASQQPQQDKEALKKALDKAGEQTGFVSREAVKKKPRKRSPYIVQKNTKMRVGMPELLAKITEAIGSGSDQETLEKALLALVEKEKKADLKKKYLELTKY